MKRYTGIPDPFHLSYRFLNWLTVSALIVVAGSLFHSLTARFEEVIPLYASSGSLARKTPLMPLDTVNFVDVVNCLVELDHITSSPAFSQSGQS